MARFYIIDSLGNISKTDDKDAAIRHYNLGSDELLDTKTEMQATESDSEQETVCGWQPIPELGAEE